MQTKLGSLITVAGLAVLGTTAALLACGSSGGGDGSSSSSGSNGNTSGFLPGDDAGGACEKKTCAELGWACGYVVDACGNVTNCADEGLACGPSEVCVGGIDAPTKCVAGGAGGACDVCSAIPDCTGKPQTTRLSGRVISPGRDDGNTANQVGVPNAVVYILRTTNEADVPAIPPGIPEGGTSCDRCNEQDLGPVLAGAVTDATGAWTIETHIPVDREFLLVVKAGRFRRATKLKLPATAACETTSLPTALPDNPTRLPRSMTDGLAVNIPRIAITTGQIDAMECVFHKMGVARSEFGNPGDGTAAPRVHLYQGGPSNNKAGMRIDASTPHDSVLYGNLSRLMKYDMLVADCEGPTWDANNFSERDSHGARVREYVNRGGRMFASHLSFSWLHGNGNTAYDAANPIATGLGQAATWSTSLDTSTNSGTGTISVGRDRASPRIDNFVEWMRSEDVVGDTAPYNFSIVEPRSQVTQLHAGTEEFVHRTGVTNGRVQQFSFNTPVNAPEAAACGRVAYSGFHVVAGGIDRYADAEFKDECNGDLSAQEKVLLYMLFDVGACVGGNPLPPSCVPVTCESIGAKCGPAPDGCGGLLDCGSCSIPK